MKNFNMPADQMQRVIHKLYHKKNILFRAFFINLAIIVLVWALVMSGAFSADWMGRLMMCAPDEAERETMNMIGIWKIAGVVLFLVPALAAWWEMRCCKKTMN